MPLISTIKNLWLHKGFQRYLSNTSWLLFGRILTLVISFLVTIYVARYLGPTNYGTLSYAVGFIGFFSFLANLGIDQILYRELIKHPEKERELLGSSFFLKLAAGIITYAIAACATIILDRDVFISSLVLIIGLSFIFQPFQIINFYFQSRVEARKTIIAQISVIILLSLSKIAIIHFNLGIYYFSAIFVLESILYALFYVQAYQKTGAIFSWKPEKETTRMILKASWPYMLATAFTVVYTRMDQLMIKHLIDTTSVGIYDAAVRIAEVWYFIPGAVISSIFPAIVNARTLNNGSYERRLLHFFGGILGITVLITVPIFLFSDQIINLLYGSRYAGAEGVLRIYVLSGIAYSFSMAMTQYLSAEHHERAIFLSSLFGMVVNVGLNIFWIPAYGINGAAWATLIAYILVPLSVLVYKPIRMHFFKILKSRLGEAK